MMCHLALQDLNPKISGYLVKIITTALAAMLILVIYGCTEHENPFDPENETTHGKPFNLKAESLFGRIKLTWKPLNMDIDFYQIYRKEGNEKKWAKLDTTVRRTYEDTTNIVSEINYSYKITAWRGSEESDPSKSVSKQSLWYPKKTKYINGTDYIPVDIAFCSTCSKCYVANDNHPNLVVVNTQTDEKAGEIVVGGNSVGVDLWHDENTGMDTLIVCNSGGYMLYIIGQESFTEYNIIDSIRFIERPKSVQIYDTLRQAFISVEDKNWIIRFDLDYLQPIDTLWIDGSIKRLLIIENKGLMIGLQNDEAKVIIIDIINWKEKHTIEFEDIAWLKDVTVLPDRNLAYIACNSLDGQGKIKVINIETGKIEEDKEIDLKNVANRENIAVSLTFVPEGLSTDDGLLFIAVHSLDIEGQETTRIFGYHIGPEIEERVDIKEISKEQPELIRIVPRSFPKKLYVLDFRGMRSYFETSF